MFTAPLTEIAANVVMIVLVIRILRALTEIEYCVDAPD